MLYSYQQVSDDFRFSMHTRAWCASALKTHVPQGLVLGPEAFDAFLDGFGMRQELQSLLDAISDDESRERVELEIVRRLSAGRISEDLAESLSEAREVLSMDEKLQVADIPLVAVLSSDVAISQTPVIVNILGMKGLADAIRILWSRLFKDTNLSDIPSASIVLYRMPPLASSVEVTVSDDSISLSSVFGWGRLVHAQEVCDSFDVSFDGVVRSKDILSQDKEVYRNPRSGEMIVQKPSQPSAQSITDDMARTLALATKRLGVSSAVFGVLEQKHWLLRVSHPRSVVSDVESVVPSETTDISEEEVSQPVVQAAPEVEIVEFSEEDDEPIDSSPIELVEEPEVIDDPMLGPIPTSSSDEPSVLAQQTLHACMNSIEKMLRDWLRGDQPDDFVSLVEKVGSKRSLPYKNRLLTLAQMRSTDNFESPSPEAVRFGLETLQRFKNEF